MILLGESTVFMFTFSCSTCETKLVVKDEKLIGKILACPNCGSMVLVQPPDGAPTSPQSSPRKTIVRKRFPDVLSNETASGIIGSAPEAIRRSEMLLESIPESQVSETELKTRKILVGILLGLSVLLLVILGFLMFPAKLPEEEKFVPPPLIDEPVIPIPIEPPRLESQPIEPPLPESPSETSPQEPLIEPEPIPTEPTHDTNDTLAALDAKLPGLVDISIPNIDIAQKLASPVFGLNLNQQNLIGFIRTMSQLTEIPMTLDIDEMKPRGLSVKTLVSGQFNETTTATILTETLATLGLQWRIVDRQILILPKATEETVDLTFDVSDFTEKTEDLNPQVLAEMIQKLICPENTISVLHNSKLVITSNESSGKSKIRQRDEIRRFLEQLRVLRQLPQTTKLVGEDLAPEAFGWDQVMEPMTLNHYWAVPLSRVVTQLEMLTDLTILVDHQSLHRSLCSFAAVQATVRCDQGTVNNVMDLLLDSVDSVALAYRIVDHQTLEITTAESVRLPEKMAVEVHRYYLQEEETPADVVRLLRLAIAPGYWAAGGDIVIDEPSNCLLIRQSQPAHRQIRLYLSELK